jgi:hypothetical protein
VSGIARRHTAQAQKQQVSLRLTLSQPCFVCSVLRAALPLTPQKPTLTLKVVHERPPVEASHICTISQRPQRLVVVVVVAACVGR